MRRTVKKYINSAPLRMLTPRNRPKIPPTDTIIKLNVFIFSKYNFVCNRNVDDCTDDIQIITNCQSTIPLSGQCLKNYFCYTISFTSDLHRVWNIFTIINSKMEEMAFICYGNFVSHNSCFYLLSKLTCMYVQLSEFRAQCTMVHNYKQDHLLSTVALLLFADKLNRHDLNTPIRRNCIERPCHCLYKKREMKTK